MPPSDNSDGSADLESENESRGNNSQGKMHRRASTSDIRTTLPVKKMKPKPAYLSSKEAVQIKGLSAFISDRLDHNVKQYCLDKSSLYNTVMVSCTPFFQMSTKRFSLSVHFSKHISVGKMERTKFVPN